MREDIKEKGKRRSNARWWYEEMQGTRRGKQGWEKGEKGIGNSDLQEWWPGNVRSKEEVK